MGAVDYGTRVWRGDNTTVAEARERYMKDPQDELIQFAVALYSFRNKKLYAEELIALRQNLIYRAAGLWNLALTSSPKDIAELADILSTHLEWISRQPMLDETERAWTSSAAMDACQYGIDIAREQPIDHTLPLLHLTKARLWINAGRITLALNCLRSAHTALWVGHIKDPNQKARVYRKLGLLYRQCEEHGQGFVWGLRAIFLRGTSMAVRAKSAAALFGIDH